MQPNRILWGEPANAVIVWFRLACAECRNVQSEGGGKILKGHLEVFRARVCKVTLHDFRGDLSTRGFSEKVEVDDPINARFGSPFQPEQANLSRVFHLINQHLHDG